MSTDIFKETKAKTVPAWAKFAKAGDRVQGTYVGKITGMIDGYGNEQTIYQLLKDDGEIVNVGFGLNKKVIHADMQSVNFGQIIGWEYLGTKSVKNKLGKMVDVKDYAFHADSKIVNEEWLKANAKNMPTAIRVNSETQPAAKVGSANEDDELDSFKENDVPFSTTGNLTNEDKLAQIEKIAKEKLGATDVASVKDKVMTVTGIAFIGPNYDAILAKLATL